MAADLSVIAEARVLVADVEKFGSVGSHYVGSDLGVDLAHAVVELADRVSTLEDALRDLLVYYAADARSEAHAKATAALAGLGADPATQETTESLCTFCRRVTRPWLTDDATWALVEPVLGQAQACLVCFYNALPSSFQGEPLRVSLPAGTA